MSLQNKFLWVYSIYGVKEMIDRPMYYERIRQFIDKPLIKVITGVRRCGKSTMMLLIQQLLIKQGVNKEQIISINFESMLYYDLRDSRSLYAYVSGAINSLLLDFPSDIYITGSNFQLLSLELSTLLTGRYIHMQMQVLSFTEMLTFRSSEGNAQTQEDFLLYILPLTMRDQPMRSLRISMIRLCSVM